MDIRIISPVKGGAVEAVSSKSQLHRALICAALSQGTTEIFCREYGEDIAATADAVSCFAHIERTEKGFLTEKSPVFLKNSFDCRESGSTYRFMLPVMSALGFEGLIYGSAALAARPISPLYEEIVRSGGVLSEKGIFPMHLKGRMRGGRFSIRGDISSQFISGMLMALPLCEEGGSIAIEGELKSAPYVDMTVEVMERFGVDIVREKGLIEIKKGSKYSSCGSFKAEGDWSAAAFWLAAGAFSEEGITVTGIDRASRQGDRRIVDVLKTFGAKATEKCVGITVSKGSLTGCEIDAADIPDLVPVMAVVAAAAKGKTVFYNTDRLRYKESDRVESVTAMINGLGGRAVPYENNIEVFGGGLKGGKISSFNDHRIAMSAAVASAICEKEVVISDAQAVSKSYKSFFKDFEALGGKVERE